MVPQITTDTTIHAMLRLLDIQPGMPVMEISTGSGCSGALLSRIVGSDGHGVSWGLSSTATTQISPSRCTAMPARSWTRSNHHQRTGGAEIAAGRSGSPE